MDVPSQASWIVEKIFDATITFLNVNDNIFQQDHFSIKGMYSNLKG